MNGCDWCGYDVVVVAEVIHVVRGSVTNRELACCETCVPLCEADGERDVEVLSVQTDLIDVRPVIGRAA